MTIATEAFLPLVLNLAASWRAVGIDNTLVVTHDEASTEALQAFHIPSCRFRAAGPSASDVDVAAGGISTNRALTFGNADYAALTRRTNDILRAFVAAGYTVAFSDADTVWLANVFDDDAWGTEPQWEMSAEGAPSVASEGASPATQGRVNPHLGHACGALRLGDVVTPLGEQMDPALLGRSDCAGGQGGDWMYDVKGMCA
jgi:hypothetical protein